MTEDTCDFGTPDPPCDNPDCRGCNNPDLMPWSELDYWVGRAALAEVDADRLADVLMIGGDKQAALAEHLRTRDERLGRS